jgi:hypothetical protein
MTFANIRVDVEPRNIGLLPLVLGLGSEVIEGGLPK